MLLNSCPTHAVITMIDSRTWNESHLLSGELPRKDAHEEVRVNEQTDDGRVD